MSIDTNNIINAIYFYAVESAMTYAVSGHYAGLLLIGSGFDTALGFDFILNVLCFLYVIRDGVE